MKAFLLKNCVSSEGSVSSASKFIAQCYLHLWWYFWNNYVSCEQLKTGTMCSMATAQVARAHRLTRRWLCNTQPTGHNPQPTTHLSKSQPHNLLYAHMHAGLPKQRTSPSQTQWQSLQIKLKSIAKQTNTDIDIEWLKDWMISVYICHTGRLCETSSSYFR